MIGNGKRDIILSLFSLHTFLLGAMIMEKELNDKLLTCILHDNILQASLCLRQLDDINAKLDLRSINNYTTINRTALSFACLLGRKEIVELILDLGARIEVKDSDHLTPFGVALLHNHIGLAEFLLSKGAYIDAVNDLGQSILFPVILHRYDPHIEFLLANGVNINHRCNVGATPLMMTVDRVYFMPLLCALGARVDLQQFDNGQTALHIATIKEHHEAVQILCRHNANPTIKDHMGKTALDYAMMSNDERMLRLLKAYS